MLSVFDLNKYPFEFNNETFYCFDKKYITYLLGKRGNQTAINTAGSAWKKTIQRYLSEKQPNKRYINPKWLELRDFLQGHLNTKDSLFKPDVAHCIKNLDALLQSTSTNDKRILGEYLRFRELLRNNLSYFKKDSSFRKKILPKIYDNNMDFRRDISPQYIYILLTLYIAKKYSMFDKYQYKQFALKICGGKEEYLERFYDGLRSNAKIENLTALCYTQYFWFDYRLSRSEHSEIHLILFNIFNELIPHA